MTLSELITQAQQILAEHGDLDIITGEDYQVGNIRHEVSRGQYPDDYEMPEGYEFVRITEYR